MVDAEEHLEGPTPNDCRVVILEGPAYTQHIRARFCNSRSQALLLCPFPIPLLKTVYLKTCWKNSPGLKAPLPTLAVGEVVLGYLEPEPGKASLCYTKLFLLEP